MAVCWGLSTPSSIVYDTQAVLCSSELVYCQKDGRSSTEHSVVFPIPWGVLDEVGIQAALVVPRSGASLSQTYISLKTSKIVHFRR